GQDAGERGLPGPAPREGTANPAAGDPHGSGERTGTGARRRAAAADRPGGRTAADRPGQAADGGPQRRVPGGTAGGDEPRGGPGDDRQGAEQRGAVGTGGADDGAAPGGAGQVTREHRK